MSYEYRVQVPLVHEFRRCRATTIISSDQEWENFRRRESGVIQSRQGGQRLTTSIFWRHANGRAVAQRACSFLRRSGDHLRHGVAKQKISGTWIKNRRCDVDSRPVGEGASAYKEMRLGLLNEGAHIDFFGIAVEGTGPRWFGARALRPFGRRHDDAGMNQGRLRPSRAEDTPRIGMKMPKVKEKSELKAKMSLTRKRKRQAAVVTVVSINCRASSIIARRPGVDQIQLFLRVCVTAAPIARAGAKILQMHAMNRARIFSRRHCDTGNAWACLQETFELHASAQGSGASLFSSERAV